MSSSWQRVTDPEGVRIFLSGGALPLLEALMVQEWTVAQLAQACRLPLNAAHYRVRRLLRAGLVHETRQQARRGRPIRHYRATSERYLVPYHATPLNTVEELVGLHEHSFAQRFLHAVVQAAAPLVQDEREIGLRFFREGDHVTFDVTPRAGAFSLAEFLRPDRPALLLDWGTLELTPDDAKALQHDLSELLSRFSGRAGPERFLFRVGLCPEGPEAG